MSEAEFYKIRIWGQLGGGLILLLGVVLMFTQQQALYFFAAYLLFCLLNYVYIHSIIGKQVNLDLRKTPQT